MTPNRRIALNIIATYGRSLYCAACGLFTSRWVLMSLGTVDYGLYGVVGGLTAFIAFFNGLLASAMSRYFAVSIGRASTTQCNHNGLDECRKWFSISLVIHLTVPLLLLLCGYPLGMWAVRNYLTIPPDRMIACEWVFRFVCVSCFIGMINVPFQAMYVAKQYIAELTIYSVVSTTANVCFLYFMVTHAGDWLARYALWTCVVSVAPQILICIRACIVFPECRFSTKGLLRWENFREILSYAGWQGLCSFGGLLRSQGVAILVNKFFGPAANASIAVAHSANGQASIMSGAVLGAFSPAIANAYGAGQIDLVRAYVYRASKFAILASLALALPLAIEIEEVLRFWLRNPPKMAGGITLLLMIGAVAEFATLPHVAAINATGNVSRSKIAYGLLLIATLPVCYIFVRSGFGLYTIGAIYSFFMIGAAISSVYFAQRQNGIAIGYWIRKIVLCSVVSAIISTTVATAVKTQFEPSIMRMSLVTVICEIVFLTCAWSVVLDDKERRVILNKVLKKNRRDT